MRLMLVSLSVSVSVLLSVSVSVSVVVKPFEVFMSEIVLVVLEVDLVVLRSGPLRSV